MANDGKSSGSTAVTRDYGKRTVIITGSARGMYATPRNCISFTLG
jgi:hypothetical protein